MMTQLGMGVMLHMLGGFDDTGIKALSEVMADKDERISSVTLHEGEDELIIRFDSGQAFRFWDNGQTCCEHRYMHTDDDLGVLVGGRLLNIDVIDGGTNGDDWVVKDSQFLKIETTTGFVTIANYNEHNGYYGGFAIEVTRIA
jgi:hypothetical protein